MNTTDIPRDVRKQIRLLAETLPPSARGQFILETCECVKGFTHANRNALTWAAIGWMIGEVVDHVFTIGIPFSDKVIELTLDHASTVGALAGGWNGHKCDSLEHLIREHALRQWGRIPA